MGLNSIKILVIAGLLCVSASSAASARQMEALGRGLIAAKTASGMLVSWRLLGTDSPTATFTLYRDGAQIAAISSSAPTTYLDAGGSASSVYTIKDAAGKTSSAVAVFENSYKDSYGSAAYRSLTLVVPADMTMQDNSTCKDYPNDMSVGDLDGDGEYDYVVDRHTFWRNCRRVFA